ncbi:MAG: helix-turn-helix domain-containing protein [Actinobacteria bacterium]|nr:helix-turn-helix domain-containing protein [Actinomycetota bacterium]
MGVKMIKNDQQHQRAERDADELRKLLEDDALHPQQKPAIQGELTRIEADIERYAAVRMRLQQEFHVDDIGDLADVLVLARIARGVTQSELADELGVSQQQVGKDENGGYHTASLTRLSDVLDALDYDVDLTVRPADSTDVAKLWLAAEDSLGTTADERQRLRVQVVGEVRQRSSATTDSSTSGLRLRSQRADFKVDA